MRKINKKPLKKSLKNRHNILNIHKGSFIIITFALGLVCFFGFYPLFYKLNKPASRWRSIALLAVILFGYPLFLLWNNIYYYGKIDAPSFFDLSLLFCSFFLLSCVLLGNNRSVALVAASFIFGIINLAQFPVVYFTIVVIYPVTDLSNFVSALYDHPYLYYEGILLSNIIITASCLLAARWLRKSMLKPPPKLYVSFTMLFVFFTLIVLVWWGDFSKVTSISYLSSFFMGTLLIGILLSLFFLYTRLSKDNSTSVINNTESTSLSALKADKYAPFIQLLSRRELEIIEAVLAGNVRYKELSSTLNISVNTVKTHLKHIYQATGVSNIAGLFSLFNGYASSKGAITRKSPQNHPKR